MFLAAAPYFQSRFRTDERVLQSFQSAIISVSTITNLGAMVLLTKMQSTASYPLRINLALYINVAVFALLTASTVAFLEATPGQYLGFLLIMVTGSALAAALVQNGTFAFASSFGRPEYVQAIMSGQGIAGVLPPLAEIISVFVAPPKEARPGEGGPHHQPGTAAFIYFLTAVVISVVAILAFIPLARRHSSIVENRMVEHMAASMTSVEDAEQAARKVVSITTLFRKLRWLAAAVFMCFVVTMFFPVFTPKIVSVSPPEQASLLLQPAVFIPLAFFFWNLGDLGGRNAALIVPCQDHPTMLFAVSIVRTLFIPMYALCNINGRGAVVNSDAFYLLIVQFPFGLSNGWLASNCMMAAGDYVEEGEREASGGFMALSLTAGLAVGSLLSFTAAGI
jgi:solute carrier family 29 (equilibrative nucleoside transporter), member 1/2/3